jgi:hypothetical protein
MSDSIDKDKLTIVVKHWIEHNHGHVAEFQTWAQRADAAGHGVVAEEIAKAVELLGCVNTRLECALGSLGLTSSEDE